MSSHLSSLASARPTRPPRWLAPVAGGVPLAYYMASCSAYGGLYEEGTFVAAARSLGVPHPPGAPITSLVSAFAALLPVGPLAFRVAMASAVFAAITLALFARALFLTSLGVGVRSTRLSALVALASTWFVAQTPLYFQQATRPNVFAVQFALALIVIEALVRFELSEPTDDRRTLYFAAFVQGLSFANHHVFGLLMLSVAAPTLGRVFARRGFLGLMGHVAAPILGFSAWVYVPIRGARLPFINIGEPSRLVRTLWVLGADPWWGPSDLPARSTLAHLRDGLGGGQPAVAYALFGIAALGFALAARAPSQRRFGVLWLIALLVPLASIAWILEPRLGSDAWGALVPCALATVALASCGIALLLQGARRFARATSGTSFALCGAALLALALKAEARGLARFDAPDLLDDLTRRNLPPRAVILSRDAGTWFRHLGAEAEEQLRADVTLVPLAAGDYPRTFEALTEVAPELSPTVTAFAKSGALALAPVHALAALRPVYLELDRTVKPTFYPWLEGDGLFERVTAHAIWRGPLLDPLVTGRELARFARLYQLLGPARRQPELATRLTRVHFFKGVRAGSLGKRAVALAHVRFGLACAPRDREILRLQAALGSDRPLAPDVLLRPAKDDEEDE